jgi:hypothetical protein
MPRYAVLWDIDRSRSFPVGVVGEHDDRVAVLLPTHYAMPRDYREPITMLRPDCREETVRPGDHQYFDSVLCDLAGTFAIGETGTSVMLDFDTIFELLVNEVIRAARGRKGEYSPERPQQVTLPHRAPAEVEAPEPHRRVRRMLPTSV